MKKITISSAIQKLKKSEVVAIPTETVYGLAAIASDQIAVKKIYQIKNRPLDNPLICHFYDFNQVLSELESPSNYLAKLVAYFSPGPVSYLVKIKSNSPFKISTCGRNSMVFRIPKHPICHQLLKELNLPLAAPSANTSGKFSGTNSQMILKDLGSKIDWVVDGGQSKIGLESTILDCRDNTQIKILRPGFIGKKELEDFFKSQKIEIKLLENESSQETTPGTKYKHYAPNTKLLLITDFADLKKVLTQLDQVLLASKESFAKLKKMDFSKNFNLKNKIDLGQNLNQISQNIYYNFYKLDQLKVSKAYLFLPEINNENSLALALKNRIQKAALGESKIH
jgi:L-threonylcarbamoyladenylate synthase